MPVNWTCAITCYRRLKVAIRHARRQGALPTYSEGNWGVTLDSSAVAADRVGIIAREFLPGYTFPTLVRVEEGKQYKVRWHVTSTQNSNRNTMFRMRARTVKFAYSQKFELGGAWGTGGQYGQPNANNAIAQQTLPGIGCLNPDRYTTDTQGGWYTLLMYTPMSADIRSEFAAGTPLAVRMPGICGQPGPGVDAASRRDLRVGCDLLDTLSSGLVSRSREWEFHCRPHRSSRAHGRTRLGRGPGQIEPGHCLREMPVIVARADADADATGRRKPACAVRIDSL